MFEITREWIFANQTDRGAWTKDQLEAIGIEWPPVHGWVDAAVGRVIADDDKWRFEEKRTRKMVINGDLFNG